MKLLFISSLERSGSTILDLKLSNYKNILSLGEVWRVIKPHGAGLESVLSRKCTCGNTADMCEFWSVVLKRIKELGEESDLSSRYKVLLEVAVERFSDDVVIVDSSKSIQALQALTVLRDIDVLVLHTLRDVRGWMDSIRRAEQRKKELPWGKIFEPDFKDFYLSYIRHNILRLIPLWLPHEWLLRNKRLDRHIKLSRFPRLDISYEALVFDTDSTFLRIRNFAGIEMDNQVCDGDAYKARLHIIRGNRTAFTSSPNKSLRYSSRWMREWKWSAVMGILPWIASFNKKHVYYYQK